MLSIQRMAICIVALSLNSCNGLIVGAGHYSVGYPFQVDLAKLPLEEKRQFEDRAKNNTQNLNWYRDHEWRPRPGFQRPRVCLSLSGGGIRSAAYSIGVLKGLNAIHTDPNGPSLLDSIDVISATSGGAYAATWYYMQHLRRDALTNAELFDDKGRYQRHLLEEADFMTLPKFLLSGLVNVGLLSPINFLLNGVWGLHANTSGAHYIYKSSIADTFHQGRSANFNDLDIVMREKRLPFLTITTTARIDDDKFHHTSSLASTVYEFTPTRFGNDGFGYHPLSSLSTSLDVANIVSIAGAAPDTSQVISGEAQRTFGSILNADYGVYILNPSDSRSFFRKTIMKLAPFPFYFFTESYNHDMRGSEIYLSDGGHQENLAAYPLVRRLCENIIIVDAEYDPDYHFEGYFKLKHALEKEMQIRMEVPKTQLCGGIAGCRENHVDKIEEVLRNNDELPYTREEAALRRKGVTVRYFSGRFPLMPGSISYFPLKNGNSMVENSEIKIVYVKLSIDEGRFIGWNSMNEDEKGEIFSDYGEVAARYFIDSVRNKCATKPFFVQCAFPQFSTSHQSFTQDQFKAYVQLGEHAVMRNLSFKIERDKIDLHVVPFSGRSRKEPVPLMSFQP